MRDRTIPPRIIRVRYCSEGPRPRRAQVLVKVPYGGIHGMYNLSQTLTRAVQTRQIRWYRIDVPRVITDEARLGLARWPAALRLTSQVTGVTWE